MTRLPFFVPPLTGSLLTRTQTAYLARGFCWLLTGERGTNRSMWDLQMVLGIHDKLPVWIKHSERDPIASHVGNQILMLTSKFWTKELGEFDSRWIALCFTQLKHQQQVSAIELATRYLIAGQYISNRQERAQLMRTNDAIPQDVLARLDQSLAHLEQSLLAKDPMMPQHLRNTHSLLISYPETVHLLEDHEVARLIDAAELHTKTEIVKAVAKGKSTGGTRAKVSVSDL